MTWHGVRTPTGGDRIEQVTKKFLIKTQILTSLIGKTYFGFYKGEKFIEA